MGDEAPAPVEHELHHEASEDNGDCLSHEQFMLDQNEAKMLKMPKEHDDKPFPLAPRSLRPYLDPSSSVSLALHSAPFSQELQQAMSVPPSSFPIGIVAHNRALQLDYAIRSILNLDGLGLEQPIIVYQDGDDESVAEVARKYAPRVQLVQHLKNRAFYFWTGSMKIAKHYRFVLSSIFEDHPGADYAIIVEDDMVFSPDFLLYFAQLAYLYDADPSIYCITSWNDNGKQGLASDPTRLYRTEFFVGLGWLASRKMWETEWHATWPREEWDWFLRDPAQRKGRECIYPEVSRNYNIGSQGVNMKMDMFTQYFKHTMVNSQPRVHLGDTSRLIKANYDSQLEEELRQATPVSSIEELKTYCNTSLVVLLDLKSPQDRRWSHFVARYFGLWPDTPCVRGMRDGKYVNSWQ